MSIQKQLNEAQARIEQLEKELGQSQNNETDLLKIIESLDSHIFRCKKDDNGNFIPLFSEGKLARKFNIDTKNIEGKTLKGVMGEEAYSVLKPYYDRAFLGETIEFREFLYYNRYYSITLAPMVTDEAGRVLEVVGITKDIDKVIRSEKEIKKTTDVLNRIIEHNPYSIQLLDANGFHVRENKAFLELFKTTPDEAWSILEDSQIEGGGLNEQIQKVLGGEVVRTSPIWYNAHLVDSKYPDNPICIGSVMFPVLLSDGSLEYIVLMHEDITERINAQKALRDSEQRKKHLLSSNPAVIYTSEVTFPFNWTFISENVTNLTGYKCDEFLEISSFWTDRIHPEDRAYVLEQLPQILEKGHMVMEYKFLRKDGTYLWIQDETKIISDEEGNPKELIGYWIDISKRKKADRELVEAKERTSS